jgi:NADH-ubiquinone oxidoreductase chain 5
MEGPTPVSALIHAATMVTAGVYLLIRCSPLIEQSELALVLIMVLGALTSFFGASVGLFQNDIKKVIAYSTLSQLGMMVIAVGLSQYNVALMHLVLHATYKAGLFLSAGSVLHALGDQQDFRRFGGLVKLLPLTYTVILIASLSLAAFPWLSGYFSKDLIIELAYGSYSSLGYLVYLLAVIAACFTMLYSVKLIYLTFLSYANAPKGNYEKTHESPLVMSIPLIILGILSVYLGSISKDFFVGLGTQGLGNSIFSHPNHTIITDTEFGVPIFNKLLPLILSTICGIVALYLFEKKPLILLSINKSKFGQNVYRFFNQRYWFELIYNRCIVKGVLYLGYVTNTVIDRGALELIGPRGAVAGLYKISNYFASFDSGSIARYGFVMFSGLLFLLLIWSAFSSPDFTSFIINYIIT